MERKNSQEGDPKSLYQHSAITEEPPWRPIPDAPFFKTGGSPKSKLLNVPSHTIVPGAETDYFQDDYFGDKERQSSNIKEK